jgi:hypothetical protein
MTWWLVTWSTYGSWLPGDPRGFQTWRGKEYVPPPKRYAKPGEETYDPSKYAKTYQLAKVMVPEPVKLTQVQRQFAVDAVVAEIAKPAATRPRLDFQLQRFAVRHLACGAEFLKQGFKRQIDRRRHSDVFANRKRLNDVLNRVGCHDGPFSWGETEELDRARAFASARSLMRSS